MPAPDCLLPKAPTGHCPQPLPRALWGQEGGGALVSGPHARGTPPGACARRPCHAAPTAGSAKKEMANTEKQEAMVFPTHVWGTLSP